MNYALLMKGQFHLWAGFRRMYQTVFYLKHKVAFWLCFSVFSFKRLLLFLQMFINQSMRKTLTSDELSPVLSLLSELAFNGLISYGSNGLSRLVFDKSDFSKLKQGAMSGIFILLFTLFSNSQNAT